MFFLCVHTFSLEFTQSFINDAPVSLLLQDDLRPIPHFATAHFSVLTAGSLVKHHGPLSLLSGFLQKFSGRFSTVVLNSLERNAISGINIQKLFGVFVYSNKHNMSE